jgi:hypothetical protein
MNAKARLIRRTLALAAIVAGVLLMWLSSETAGGVFVMLSGIALEIVGIKIDHQA